jgi:hypothetical protein
MEKKKIYVKYLETPNKGALKTGVEPEWFNTMKSSSPFIARIG